MIEIGRESPLSRGTRRFAETIGTIAAVLVLVWIIRGFVGLQQYSADIILVSFSLWFLGRILRTETRTGAGRALVTLLWNLCAAFLLVTFSVWFLGWIASLQSDVFPSIIASRVPIFVIGAIATGLGAYAVQKLGLAWKWMAIPFAVAEGRGPAIEGTKLTLKRETVGMPIRRAGRTIGCVLLGDVSTSFQTPMGAVSTSLGGPVTTVGIPFKGRRLSKDEVVKLTGKTPDKLLEESNLRAETIDVGRIRVRDGCMGDRWKIGPLIFDWDQDGEHHPGERWLAKGIGNSYVTTDGHHSSAKWNGSSLSLGDGTMELAVGSDSFSYSPTEVKTASPHHSLQVTKDKITLDTRKFTLKISGDNVVLRTEDKTSRTESNGLASDLRTVLTETAKMQVKSVMEGEPMELDDMFARTEGVLKRHE